MEKLLTKDDLAGLLQVDKRTIERLAADGILPAGRKIGRSVRWLEGEVEAAIRTAPSAAPLVAVRFVERFGPYNRGETAGFPEAEAAIALSAGVAELVNLFDDFPRVRRHLLELAKQQLADDTRKVWLQRGIDLQLQADRLAAETRAASDGGDEPDDDLGDGDEPVNGGPGIPPEVQGLREQAIRRNREPVDAN